MHQVKYTSAYKKSYKLMIKRGMDMSALNNVVDTLRQGKQLDEKYRDHGSYRKLYRLQRVPYQARLVTGLPY